MESELPIWEIKGVPFFVDVMKWELRECGNANNVMNVYEMTYHEQGYHFFFDEDTKNMRFDMNIWYDPMDLMPMMSQLDPIGMAERLGVSELSVKGKSDFELLNDQAKYNERMNGILPTFWIGDEEFIVDVSVGVEEFRGVENNKVIRYLELSVSDEYQDKLKGFYQPETGKIFPLSTIISELPNDAVYIEVPKAGYIDPIGCARRHGFDEKQILMRYPIQAKIEVKLIPLAEYVQKINERNKIEQTAKKGTKRKRRKGL